MITMFTSLITIQENNMILKGEMQIITELEYISNIMDDYLMDKIGYELPAGIEAFPNAISNEIWFNTKLDAGDETIYLVKINTGSEDASLGYPLYMRIVDKPNIGPIYIAEPIEFICNDIDGNVINAAALATVAGRAGIRSIQIELVVYQGQYGADTMRARNLVFRKYFPNLAI